jgi:FkbM family methyltransferase
VVISLQGGSAHERIPSMVETSRLLRNVGRIPELISASRHTTASRQLIAHYLQLGVTGRLYPLRVPLTTSGTLTLESFSEVKVFWQIFVRGSYKLPRKCHSILDCGANVGIFSVWAARQRPDAEIVAVEPYPDTLASLEANIRANALEGRVRRVPMALAAASGERHIQSEGDSPDRRLLPDDVAHPDRAVAVRCLTLAECLDLANFDTVDLLKMDIEGSEWGVLLSTPPAALARVHNLHLEYHEVHRRFGCSPEKLFAHLAASGLELTQRTEDAHRTGLAYFERQPH